MSSSWGIFKILVIWHNTNNYAMSDVMRCFVRKERYLYFFTDIVEEMWYVSV